MTPFKLLAAASIAVVTLATPAMAGRSCLAMVHVPKIARTALPTARYAGGHVRITTPGVGAHVTAPVTGPGGVCDAGDNPFIC